MQIWRKMIEWFKNFKSSDQQEIEDWANDVLGELNER